MGPLSSASELRGCLAEDHLTAEEAGGAATAGGRKSDDPNPEQRPPSSNNASPSAETTETAPHSLGDR